MKKHDLTEGTFYRYCALPQPVFPRSKLPSKRAPASKAALSQTQLEERRIKEEKKRERELKAQQRKGATVVLFVAESLHPHATYLWRLSNSENDELHVIYTGCLVFKVFAN